VAGWVPILSLNHHIRFGDRFLQFGNAVDGRRAVGHEETAGGGAEVVLHVDDDQRRLLALAFVVLGVPFFLGALFF